MYVYVSVFVYVHVYVCFSACVFSMCLRACVTCMHVCITIRLCAYHISYVCCVASYSLLHRLLIQFKFNLTSLHLMTSGLCVSARILNEKEI